MSTKITKRQKQILDFINSFVQENSFAPTFSEIGKFFQLKSPATIHQHIAALKAKGFIQGDFNAKRALEVLRPADQFSAAAFQLPLVGLITAGEPIEAIEEHETVAVPSSLVLHQANTFVLRVRGDSMVEDGILSGDYVVVERDHSPHDGDIVVALLDNAYATLKRFYREAKRIRLQPANGNYKPIYVKDVLIQGVVRGVIRNYQTV